ncbi:GNAT family N-acetyltransferase [Lunatibacter salilacus]|uniref:GNAT family N-acetyltransferase n=1 Tax=Lunatibacter salilacus TaxID=2483804 RepID=UPI00131E1E00|nr:GNAT family N-acetyltransferase [Lunatibacter salilacus]
MKAVIIKEFQDDLAPYFLSINKEWIEKFFSIEAFDREQLENPRKNIVDKGGQVWFAEYKGQIVGTAAMRWVEDGVYELIKMGVTPQAQGRSIGQLLAESAVQWAKGQGANRVVLYSNTCLSPAIRLYHRLGFVEVPIESGKYQRCDIKMEIVF